MIPFERTVCACAECVTCCKTQPGPLAPGDFERIVAHVGQPADVMASLFVASKGATVYDRRTSRIRQVGTIVPRADADGRCVFLGPDDRCQIHAVAPFGCAYCDTHQDFDDAHARSVWIVHAIERAPAYAALRETLEPAATYRPRSFV